MDMWDPYIAATKAYVPKADKKIVFDRFHVMRHVLEAVDKVRKTEHHLLRERGEETLKGTKYLWLWSQENIPFWRQEEFELLRSKDLKVCRAWAIKENLRHMSDTGMRRICATTSSAGISGRRIRGLSRSRKPPRRSRLIWTISSPMHVTESPMLWERL